MKNYVYLGFITVAYVTLQLISDVTAGKLIAVGVLTVSATMLYFPFTYIISDVLTEVYGYAIARRVMWQVLLASVVAGLLYQVVVWLPAAPGFEAADAYARVLGSVPRILIGGWVAVFVGAILNDYMMAKMKVWTKGKHLWARTIGSTIVGEGANTALFYAIALAGIIPTSLLVSSILSGWVIKVAVEVAMTPVTYRVVAFLKRAEGIDHYDRDTNFNPFNLKS
jgi:uncharacterized integral membrane protein (TIGR00697 family)